MHWTSITPGLYTVCDAATPGLHPASRHFCTRHTCVQHDNIPTSVGVPCARNGPVNGKVLRTGGASVHAPAYAFRLRLEGRPLRSGFARILHTVRTPFARDTSGPEQRFTPRRKPLRKTFTPGDKKRTENTVLQDRLPPVLGAMREITHNAMPGSARKQATDECDAKRRYLFGACIAARHDRGMRCAHFSDE